MYTKQPKDQKKDVKTQKPAIVPNKEPNQLTKSNSGKELSLVCNLPIPKYIQERVFNCLIHAFTIIKSSPFSFFPNGPK